MAADRAVNAFSSLVSQMQKEPAQANPQFRVRVRLDEGVFAKFFIKGFELISDELEVLGGTSRAPNPVELVLDALSAFQGIVILAHAAVPGVKSDDTDVDVKGDIDLRRSLEVADVRPGRNNVGLSTTIKTPESDNMKLERLIRSAEEKCPVYACQSGKSMRYVKSRRSSLKC